MKQASTQKVCEVFRSRCSVCPLATGLLHRSRHSLLGGCLCAGFDLANITDKVWKSGVNIVPNACSLARRHRIVPMPTREYATRSISHIYDVNLISSRRWVLPCSWAMRDYPSVPGGWRCNRPRGNPEAIDFHRRLFECHRTLLSAHGLD